MIRSIYSTILMSKNWLLNQFDIPVIVLLYHRVTVLDSDPQLLAVTPDNFREQMTFLKSNFPVLRFEDEWSDVKEPSVVVTFDDGYADNALEALPILEEVEVPATFFVSTGSIEGEREFWWDEIERIILGKGPFPKSFILVDSFYGREWLTTDISQRHEMYQDMYLLMKKIENSRKKDWLRQLRDWTIVKEEGRETHRAMTIAELCKLDQSQLATVGAHTITHSQLSALSPQQQREEIFGSKKQLESWVGHEVKVFSYPFGAKSDYNRESVRICKEAGFSKAISNFSGQVHRWTDPYQIPRQLVRNWPLGLFKKMLNRFIIS